MSVVKSLALGASILGSLVAPTLAGSIRASHRLPDRSQRAVLPDTPRRPSAAADSRLASVADSGPVAAATLAPVAVAPTSLRVLRPSQENLASGVATPGQTFAGYLVASSASASAGPLMLGVSNGGVLAGNRMSNLAVASAPADPAPGSALPAPPAPAASAPTMAAPATGHDVAALINFGNAPYSEAQSLTTGNPQSWTQSSAVQSVFGGTPTAAQQDAFKNEVLATVQGIYNRSGLNISLTTDPSRNFAHTMSVVSGASFPGNPNAIGVTDVGNDGFSFIDKFNMAKTPDELAAAIGHNVAHELMHAFGVAGHPDTSGTYLDAASANWSTLTNANTTFSPQAAQMLAAQNFLGGPGKLFTQGALGLTGLEVLSQHHIQSCHCKVCNALHALEAAEGISVNGGTPVPEPTTYALWSCGAVGVVVVRRRRAGRVEA